MAHAANASLDGLPNVPYEDFNFDSFLFIALSFMISSKIKIKKKKTSFDKTLQTQKEKKQNFKLKTKNTEEKNKTNEKTLVSFETVPLSPALIEANQTFFCILFFQFLSTLLF